MEIPHSCYIIDQGNHNTKMVRVVDALFGEKHTMPNELWQPEFQEGEEVLFNSVSPFLADHWNIIKSQTRRAFQIDRFGPLPFSMNYRTPETLGMDRLAHAAWACSKHPNTTMLVIDFGTCMTSTLIDANQALCGGTISPGLQSRFQSLHDYTAGLPLLHSNSLDTISFPGKTTQESIYFGVRIGMQAEMDALIEKTLSLFPQAHVALTGGDASLFAVSSETPTFVVENLNLEGFYALHQHQNYRPH